MPVSISVPISESIPTEGLYTSEEISLAAFSPTAKDTLRRILAGCLAASTTLANGAPVDSVARVLEWAAEQVHAGE